MSTLLHRNSPEIISDLLQPYERPGERNEKGTFIILTDGPGRNLFGPASDESAYVLEIDCARLVAF